MSSPWRKKPTLRTILWLLLLSLMPMRAIAQELMTPVHTTATITVALGEPVLSSDLEQMRGGFLSESGLQFAFSFDSVTRVNGDVLAQTSVVVPMLSLIDGPNPSKVLPDVQSMSASSFSRNALGDGQFVGSSLSPVVIQNTLDRQAIDTLSVLDLQLYGTANLGARAVHTAVLPSTIASLKQ